MQSCFWPCLSFARRVQPRRPVLLALIAFLASGSPLFSQHVATPDARSRDAASDTIGASTAEIAAATVLVKSGRTFVGLVDARTDQGTLWLRFEHGRSTLWRPIEWDRVVQVAVDGDHYSGEEFQRVAAKYATHEDSGRRNWIANASQSDETATGNTTEITSTTHRVRALSIDVQFANWDADAQDDGLLARVAPLDEFGRAIAADGTLTVDLIAMTGKRRPLWPIASHEPDVERPVLESWTFQLSPGDFVDGIATLKLEFAHGDPAANPLVHSLGVVRARFASPGSDLVEAVVDPVRLRPVAKIGATRQ